VLVSQEGLYSMEIVLVRGSGPIKPLGFILETTGKKHQI
jgi:hypothetical protein